MTINSLKELDKLIALCRKRGINAIKIDNIEFTLSPIVNQQSNQIDTDAFPEASLKIPQYTPGSVVEENGKIETTELTEEQLLMWSAQPEILSEAKQ